MALLGFSYHLMPQRDSNPRRQSCTRLGSLKDALPTELPRCNLSPVKILHFGIMQTRLKKINVTSRGTSHEVSRHVAKKKDKADAKNNPKSSILRKYEIKKDEE